MSVMNSNGELKSSGASVVKAGSWEIRQRCIGIIRLWPIQGELGYSHQIAGQGSLRELMNLNQMNLNCTCQGYRTGVEQKMVIYSIRCCIGTLLQEQGTAGKETSDACPCLPQLSR